MEVPLWQHGSDDDYGAEEEQPSSGCHRSPVDAQELRAAVRACGLAACQGLEAPGGAVGWLIVTEKESPAVLLHVASVDSLLWFRPQDAGSSIMGGASDCLDSPQVRRIFPSQRPKST